MSEDRGALSKEDRQHETTHDNYFLGSWLREDKDGKVGGIEEDMRRRSREEEIKRELSEVEEEMERVAVDCKRACLDFRFVFGRKPFRGGRCGGSVGG